MISLPIACVIQCKRGNNNDPSSDDTTRFNASKHLPFSSLCLLVLLFLSLRIHSFGSKEEKKKRNVGNEVVVFTLRCLIQRICYKISEASFLATISVTISLRATYVNNNAITAPLSPPNAITPPLKLY